MEMVKRGVVGEVVWVEVLRWGSAGHRPYSLGLDRGGDAPRGGAAGRGHDSVQNLRFGRAKPDRLVR